MPADALLPAEGWRVALAAVERVVARAAREPLLQFLAAALLLFLASSLIHGPEQQLSGDLITVSRGRVEQLADSYRLLAGRLPSRVELQALVDDFIDEEIDYREAVAMGLDADDTIVRRRMRQKLLFLAEDAEASEEPNDEQLSAWLNLHRAEYRLPERISLRQVLASGDKRGVEATAHAVEMLDRLRAGADPQQLGDTSMLPSALPLTTAQGVAMLFGESFASGVFNHQNGGWFGPLTSPFGAHDVLIISREPARDPPLDEIRDKLASDWIDARRTAWRDQFQARLRQRYQVRVDWPGPYASQPSPQGVPRIRHPLDDVSGE